MAHDTRFKNGLAFGPYNNFFARTDGLFVQADTTPDVTDFNMYFSNNTTTTIITDFEFSVPGGGSGNESGHFQGKEITVFFLDDSTSLASNARILLSGSNSLQGTNNNITLRYVNSSWIETSRSYSQSNIINVSSVGWLTATGNPVMNASTGNINVRGRGNLISIRDISEASSNMALRRAVGGEQGALLTITAAGGSDTLVICNSAAADTFVCMSSASSTQFRLQSSASILFTRHLNKWHEIVTIFPNSSTILAK